MELDLREYTRLKEAAERTRQEASRAEGVLAHLLEELGKLGCNSEEQAETRLSKLKRRRERLAADAAAALAEFKREFAERLGDE